MEHPRNITMIQVSIIIFSTIVGVGVLALPRFATISGNTAAPLLTLGGSAFAFLSVWILALLGMRFPSNTIIIYSEKLIGKFPARCFSLLIILFFAILTALTAREFGEVVVTAVLKETPLEITVIVMLTLASLSTRYDITTFAYIHHFYFPFILFPALLIIGLSLKNAEFVHLLPITGLDKSHFGKGILTISALFQGSFVLSMVIPSMRNPKRTMKSVLWGFGMAAGLYLLIVIATLSVFGFEETQLMLWPLLELAKTTSLPANILERLDAAFLAVWVTAVFTTLLSTYFLTIHATGQLFRYRDHKMLSMFLLPFIFLLAMFPQNEFQLYNVIQTIGGIGLIITLGYPALLLITAWIRRKKEKMPVEATHEPAPE